MGRATRTRGYARGNARGGIELFTRPHQTLVVRVLGLLVRLRAELCVIVVVVTGHALLVGAGMETTWAWITEATVIAVVLAVPVSRRYVFRRCWAVMSRHRIRACLVNTRAMAPMTYNGKLPYLLWSRPSPIGERIRVWLPAGLSVKDIETVSDRLAAACWAIETRIEPSPRHAMVCMIEIVRRDPLGTSRVLRPQVVDALPEPVTAHGNVIPLPRRDQVVNHMAPTTAPKSAAPPVPAEQPGNPTPVTDGRQRRATSTITRTDNDPAPRGLGGMDMSDYV
jgi:hypothetical protein